VQWFEQSSDLIYGKDLETHPFFKAMWGKDIGVLNEILFEVAIPLKVNTKLIGFILLCHKDVRSIDEIKHVEQVSMVCITASLAIMNALMYDKAKVEASTDSLTSTFNHRYFMDQLTTSTQACKQTMALALVGIDMFTVYNDIYGSYAGDTALVMVSNRIKQICGNQAIVCRYGGDIFALIIPNLDTKLAYDLCEKIRVQIEKISVATDDEPIRTITVSCGLCIYPSMANDDKNLLKNAGLAMFNAKHTGRNKTVIFNSTIVDNPDESTNLDENQWATIYALTATIDAKDHFTFGHSQRVAKYATAIAEAMGAKAFDIELIRQASLLHDIGKIGIPEAVLTKTTRLNEEEYDAMKRHVDLSVTIIKYLPSFNKVVPSVIGHHERFDGTGYPRHLLGENIPFGARCIAIADAFDAITSDRHYKANMTVEFALQEVLKNAGTQFDPEMANVFIRLINEGQLIIEPSRRTNSAEPIPDKLS
ncbi:MAG: diguanylate cyclase, partial [Erysipelotrichaceae bacterium]